ncbi:hypothetical protein KUF83_35915 [Streptomyces sp. BV286]|uniref:hypothetical protein n=1 Tax=unclassified Streptomyces TaxID=2593676 RepID=UPI001C2E261B|nr:hypothetical protein [Streptomyces sp. BV286]
MPVPARRLPSWAWVTGLTAAALVLVAVLAVKADEGPEPTASASPKPSASAGVKPSASPGKSEQPAAVPDGSGTGRRIVYSLAQRRVWLVDASDAPRRTFKVWPGTVGPEPGNYTVGTRREAATGSDGVEIEHIVYFAVASGVNVAFSNAVDGSSPPPPASGTTTGGVRMKAADGDAVWKFGTAGTTVAVVK